MMMMLKKKSMILGLGILLSLLSPGLALADTKPMLNSELLGMENVLEVISNVNIRQVDTKTNQVLKDVVEAKNQIYQDGPQVRIVQHGQPSHQLATFGKRPPVSKAQRMF